MFSRLMRRPPRTARLPAFTPEDEQYALQHACVPEQVVSLMRAISGAQPLRLENFLGYAKDDWLIFVGYPLEGEFSLADCTRSIQQASRLCTPRRLFFIGPQPPAEAPGNCIQRQSDFYYRLDLDTFALRSRQRHSLASAAALQVTQEAEFTPQHQALVAEFMQRQALPPLVAALYQAMPQYLGHAPGACLLSARDAAGQLAALYVIDQAAPTFDAYLLGCYSLAHRLAHASDLLFYEMIQRARRAGKTSLQLGLGVNEGIRRFKEKWGGVACLPYEYGEYDLAPPLALAFLDTWMEGKN
jgi:hypothetical protein